MVRIDICVHVRHIKYALLCSEACIAELNRIFIYHAYKAYNRR